MSGDPACWAHLLCPECGAVLDGGSHRPDCRLDLAEWEARQHAVDQAERGHGRPS